MKKLFCQETLTNIIPFEIVSSQETLTKLNFSFYFFRLFHNLPISILIAVEC